MIRRTAQPLFRVSWCLGAVLAAFVLGGCAGKGAIREKSSREWYDQGARLLQRPDKNLDYWDGEP